MACTWLDLVEYSPIFFARFFTWRFLHGEGSFNTEQAYPNLGIYDIQDPLPKCENTSVPNYMYYNCGKAISIRCKSNGKGFSLLDSQIILFCEHGKSPKCALYISL